MPINIILLGLLSRPLKLESTLGVTVKDCHFIISQVTYFSNITKYTEKYLIRLITYV